MAADTLQKFVHFLPTAFSCTTHRSERIEFHAMLLKLFKSHHHLVETGTSTQVKPETVMYIPRAIQ